MRKKKQQLTAEEQLSNERERQLKDLEECVRFVPVPTYRFNTGDVVRYGAMKTAVVEEVLHDGKAYLLLCSHQKLSSTEIKTANAEDLCYRLANWLSVRPIPNETNNTVFAQKEWDNFSTRYQGCVESIIHKAMFFGIDMNPSYQRDFVWNMNEKTKLLDSIFHYIDIGQFALLRLNNPTSHLYEIIDGKQRLNAILDFYENKFPYNGKYFNELSLSDQNAFLNFNIAFCIIDENTVDRNKILEYINR